MDRPTRTTNRLHFTDLDPSRFEDFCLNLVYPLNVWQDIRHYGRKGTDGGVDILAIEQLENGEKRRWIIQCRRFSKATQSVLKRAVDDSIALEKTSPDVLLVVIACDVRRKAHEYFIEYAGQKKIKQPILWTQSILETKLYTERRDLLYTYFGISDAIQVRNRIETIKRNIDLKKRMKRDFWRKDQPPKVDHRYERLAKREAIIHSIDDSAYPEIDLTPAGISSWFRVELYDFYHNGIMVILGIYRGIMDETEQWAIIDHEQEFDQTKFSEIRMFRLGCIPYRNIVDYDLEGDEYYGGRPHIYCIFAEAGTPYEDYRYVRFEEGTYDLPLASEDRFEYPEKTESK